MPIYGAALMGGGSGPAFAAIGAIYPAGAICTCSYNGQTLTAKDTSGRALFLVPSAGQWLVKATNGGQEVEDTVSITTQGQVASVTLAFFTATISVTYPAGSNCTCTDGTTTLTAPDTSGSYTFTVPNTGTWTATATDGDKTKSITVSITADGQSESVTLSYELVAFDAGTTDSSVGGWSGNASVKKSSLYFYTNSGQTAWGYSGNSIDLKNYTKITFYISQLTSQDNSTTKVGVGTTDGFSASTTLPTGSGAWSTTNLTKSVDISSVDDARITLYASSSNSTAAANMNITKIVLE